jgi:hypothetical protein
MTDLYASDENLIEVLKNNGFIETTSPENKIKGKKSFKLTKQSRKEVYFNYDNIDVIVGNRIKSTLRLSKDDLRIILLYFKLPPNDLKELGPFDFSSINQKLASLQKELKALREYKLNKPRQNKIVRILNIYSSFNNLS